MNTNYPIIEKKTIVPFEQDSAVVWLENDEEIDRLTGVETVDTLDRRLLRGFPGVSWES